MDKDELKKIRIPPEYMIKLNELDEDDEWLDDKYDDIYNEMYENRKSDN